MKDLRKFRSPPKGMEIIPVAMMDDALKHAMVRMPVPIEWDEVAEESR